MCKPRFQAITIAAFFCALSALPAMAESQARIVRLSDVQGAVQIDKNSGLGFERAFANLPITQQTQLRTAENGRAEIEFEDGSTLRIVPNTSVLFSTLTLTDSGQRVSVVDLAQGRAYVNWLGKSGDELTLNFSGEKVQLRQPAHFRVEISASLVEVASFKNIVEVESPAGTVKVEKEKMATFDLNNNDKPEIEKTTQQDAYDQWDAQSTDYHNQYSKNNSTPYGYGASDLSYYGGYTDVPGYGTLWQPYFAGAGWNPFMDGAWSWYPGMGFMWASAYPWGWTPYLYGNWLFAPGFGWGWQPGGWSTWHGGVHYVGAFAAGFHAPAMPAGTVNAVVVGRGGPVASNATTTMVVNEGSAGLGIPRGSYENLKSFNKQVAKSGSVELHAAPQFAASSARSGFGVGGLHPMGEAGHAGSAASAHASGGGHAGR
jgi:hypothetical protein